MCYIYEGSYRTYVDMNDIEINTAQGLAVSHHKQSVPPLCLASIYLSH